MREREEEEQSVVERPRYARPEAGDDGIEPQERREREREREREKHAVCLDAHAMQGLIPLIMSAER
eukprot:2450072-Rhodomonas_salina.1